MTSVGNKGKFSDRLKRMKLIRYAKITNVKINGIFWLQNIDDHNVIVNKSVDNVNLTNIRINYNATLFEDIVENKKNIVNEGDKFVFEHKSNVDNCSYFVKKNVAVVAGLANVISNNMVNNSSNNIDKNSVNDVKVDIGIGEQLHNDVIGNINGVNEVVHDVFFEKTDVKNNIIVDKYKSNVDNASYFVKKNVAVVAGLANVISNNMVNNSSNNIDKNSVNDVKGYISIGEQLHNDVVGSVNEVVHNVFLKKTDTNDKKSYLSAQIIKKIRREFESKLNEIDVLESELYILNAKNEYELDLDRCRKIKEEIRTLISKINHIIEQYNIYQYNSFLDDMLYIDDNTLVDDISDFKRIYDGCELKDRLVSDYELIIEYQTLYNKLEDIKSKVVDVSEKNDDKIVNYDIRDKKYENIKDNIFKLEDFNRDCDYYIKKQNEYVDDVYKKVGKIDIEYITHYKLHGFGNLVGGTLKYLGMLMSAPFIPLMPNVAFRNYAADRLVYNLRNALRLEKVTSAVYKFQDFQLEIEDKITTLDYNCNNVDKTLDNIKKLKSEFMEQYSCDLPLYDKTLKDINEIESLVYNNREKLNIVRDKLKKNKLINENTLKKVRILEKESKPIIEKV